MKKHLTIGYLKLRYDIITNKIGDINATPYYN